jgi:26S proteasome regulatory subunit N6
MAGVLQVEEADYTTAYSYFLEAYDNYEATKNPRAVACLQYMILSKVLNGEVKNISKPTGGSSDSLGEVNIVSDLTALLSSSKVALRYAAARDESTSSGGGASGSQLRDLEAMIHISKAAGIKSLERFKHVVTVYNDVFQKDVLISHNLERLYDKMLEQNLLKIISPYSCVEISYVAQRIKLPYDVVERKLSQMILDIRFSGILDQGKGHLIIFPAKKDVSNMSKGLEVIENMTQAVQSLAARAKKLNNSVAV